jgi:hypothetical protein
LRHGLEKRAQIGFGVGLSNPGGDPDRDQPLCWCPKADATLDQIAQFVFIEAVDIIGCGARLGFGLWFPDRGQVEFIGFIDVSFVVVADQHLDRVPADHRA